MKSGKRATIYFALSAVVFLLGGGFAFMLFGSLGDKASEIAKLKAEARKPEELEAELADAKAAREESGIKLAHLERGIPELAYVPTMLKELESFGTKSGVRVFGVRPFITAAEPSKKEKKKAQSKPYTELTIEIKGKGKYRNVMNFVKAMTSFPKIVAVRTVTLAPKNETVHDLSQLAVTIELRAYLFKPENGEVTGFPVEPATGAENPDDKKSGSPSGLPTKISDSKSTASFTAPGGNS